MTDDFREPNPDDLDPVYCHRCGAYCTELRKHVVDEWLCEACAEEPACRCGQTDDVRIVRLRVPGKATTYQQDVVRLCRACRDELRGRWMYVQERGEK